MSPWSGTSSRWCPTQEQLMILEEMYRGGIKTPNATQIQRITAHLSSYGKIEGKNVFYWFQNHKARDRQKLRRKLSLLLTTHQQQLRTYQHKLLYHSPNYDHHLLHHPPASNSHLPPLHQVIGGVEDISTRLPMNCKQVLRKSMAVPAERSKMDSSLLIHKTWNSQYGWWSWRRRMMMMMMMDVGPDPPRCNRPLKTLQLFPIATTTPQRSVHLALPPNPINYLSL